MSAVRGRHVVCRHKVVVQNGGGWLMAVESGKNATFKVCVAKKKNEALSICSYELRALDGGEMPPFSAGAHIACEQGICRLA